MAITYGFYNSLNKDRVYNAEQMSSIFNGIITDGVFSTIGDALMPIAGTGMQVIVKTGKCWFNSTWTLNDALLPLDIEAADVSLTRIDAIIVEINSSIGTRANTIKMLKGTPSANPAKPALANSEHLHQYALGYVTVSAGVTSITADKIEVNVGKSTCRSSHLFFSRLTSMICLTNGMLSLVHGLQMFSLSFLAISPLISRDRLMP